MDGFYEGKRYKVNHFMVKTLSVAPFVITDRGRLTAVLGTASEFSELLLRPIPITLCFTVGSEQKT